MPTMATSQVYTVPRLAPIYDAPLPALRRAGTFLHTVARLPEDVFPSSTDSAMRWLNGVTVRDIMAAGPGAQMATAFGQNESPVISDGADSPTGCIDPDDVGDTVMQPATLDIAKCLAGDYFAPIMIELDVPSIALDRSTDDPALMRALIDAYSSPWFARQLEAGPDSPDIGFRNVNQVADSGSLNVVGTAKSIVTVIAAIENAMQVVAGLTSYRMLGHSEYHILMSPGMLTNAVAQDVAVYEPSIDGFVTPLGTRIIADAGFVGYELDAGYNTAFETVYGVAGLRWAMSDIIDLGVVGEVGDVLGLGRNLQTRRFQRFGLLTFNPAGVVAGYASWKRQAADA